MNPKDLVGAKKAPLRYVPPALMIEVAPIMENGAMKYGPFNWREQPVSAVTYVEAAQRHLFAWMDGQDDAEDSGLSHLAHAVASLGILMDAKAAGKLLDDRFTSGPAADILRRLDKSAVPQPVEQPEPWNSGGTVYGMDRAEWDAHGKPPSPSMATLLSHVRTGQDPFSHGAPGAYDCTVPGCTVQGHKRPSESDPPRFLCGHSFGEEPTEGCGTAVHWSRVNGIERQPNDDPPLISICENSGNHFSGRHLLICPEFT